MSSVELDAQDSEKEFCLIRGVKLTVEDAEEEMKLLIQFWIGELGDAYGMVHPYSTFRIAFEDAPLGLSMFLGSERIMELCEEIHKSEDADGSARLQTIFDDFNSKYFAGRLPRYQVRMVCDIDFHRVRPVIKSPTRRSCHLAYEQFAARPFEPTGHQKSSSHRPTKKADSCGPEQRLRRPDVFIDSPTVSCCDQHGGRAP